MTFQATRIYRFLLSLSVILFISVLANAYTVVLKDGRRLEIPKEFVVSKLTLTYEVAPGFQTTLQMASIDVPATERANNEPAGSLLRRATIQTVPISSQLPSARRSVTNQNLERFQRARLQSEAAYERRRKELGLPSLEESRRLAEQQANRAREQLLATRAQEGEVESYWRSRASELRAEIAATNARIEFVRARLNELPPLPAFGVFSTALPFGLITSRFGSTTPRPFHRPNVFLPRSDGPQISGRVHLGGGPTTGRVFVNPANRFRQLRSFGVFPAVPLLSIPFQNYDYSYERSALMEQLDELLAQRAGLQARWRDLEEEARRAGAYPGWLRP